MIVLDISYMNAYDKQMHTNIDLRPLHRIAILASVDVVSTVTIKDLARVTPCADWRLADLLTHMTAQHLGFAAAARGHGADPAIWQPATVADAVAADPAGSYAAAAAQVIDAFAGLDELDAMFALPEFGPGATFPGSMAIGFHFVDYVVHGWDVARTMVDPFELSALRRGRRLAHRARRARRRIPRRRQCAVWPVDPGARPVGQTTSMYPCDRPSPQSGYQPAAA